MEKKPGKQQTAAGAAVGLRERRLLEKNADVLQKKRKTPLKLEVNNNPSEDEGLSTFVNIDSEDEYYACCKDPNTE